MLKNLGWAFCTNICNSSFLNECFSSTFFFVKRQCAALKELEFYMENTTFGPNKFAKGTIITVNSLIGLHGYLKEKFGIKYFMCSHVDQAQCPHQKFNWISYPLNKIFIGWKGTLQGFKKYFASNPRKSGI